MGYSFAVQRAYVYRHKLTYTSSTLDPTYSSTTPPCINPHYSGQAMQELDSSTINSRS
jgi:hypothetical protein